MPNVRKKHALLKRADDNLNRWLRPAETIVQSSGFSRPILPVRAHEADSLPVMTHAADSMPELRHDPLPQNPPAEIPPPLKLADGIYHVGDNVTQDGLNCHPYVLIDGDEAVLFDPGSALDIEIVLARLTQLIPLSQVKYVVVHHQDPDFCGGLPYLEQMGLNAPIVTSWRSMTLLQYYKITSEHYLLEEHANALTLASGRRLEFIMTPYLHFAGSFMTYDRQTQTLFSSDLFGAFTYNKTFYADELYVEKMCAFHEHYMPCNAILRPVMELLMGYRIDRILPQHGSLIIKDIPKYIHALRDLECGSLMRPVKKSLLASGGFLTVFNEILRRYVAIYPAQEVLEVFAALPGFVIDEQPQIVDLTEDGHLLWEQMFDKIQEEKGLLWLAVIEPYAKNLAFTYSLPEPNVFNMLLFRAQETHDQLLEINKQLDATMKAVQERLVRCPFTGLYNEYFLKNLLLQELEQEEWSRLGALLFVNIDDFPKFRQAHGEVEAKNVLINMAYLLKEQFGETSVFKMSRADFAVYMKGYDPNAVVKMAEHLRQMVAASNLFIDQTTVSIGVAFPSEIPLSSLSGEGALDSYLNVALSRVRRAYELGKNIVSHTGSYTSLSADVFRVLVADSDHTHQEVLRMFLTELGIEVYTASDGLEAQEVAEGLLPQLIISDVMLPKIDGFLLKERLLQRSDTKDIEFIFVSHYKDEASVTRAMDLGILHYLKKPYLLSELVGITKNKRKGLME